MLPNIMLKRWNTIIVSINSLIRALDELIPKKIERKERRGRKPKYDLREYIKLICLKEIKRASLREAETDYSEIICKERVDHSVIHYWEKKLDKEFIETMIEEIGRKIEELVDYRFSVLDSTKFTSWNINLTEFHLLIRVNEETIYPSNILFGSETPERVSKKILVSGRGELLADSWYDDRKAIREMFKQGYNPVVKPNKKRFRGRYRKRARSLYNPLEFKQRYRKRSIGESIFGSLTNWFGDRLKVSKEEVMRVRIGARIIGYLAKIYIRYSFLLLVFRNF